MTTEEINDYEDAVSYILTIPRFSGKNEKEMTDAFYRYLGCPGQSIQLIHVAGTNGKGSVCAFLKFICREMGKTTGLFTSPHLVDIRERICLNEDMIDQMSFLMAFRQVCTKAEEFRHQKAGAEEYFPSFFEMLFLIAMVYFEKEKPDIIILETGLGGRLDATNSVIHKAACVITEIGFDHMEYLGHTLGEIAEEKAGIIRKNVPVIFWQNRQQVTEVIEGKAAVESIFCIPVSKEDIRTLQVHDKVIDFSYKSRYYEYIELSIHTRALYQAENAVLALKTAETVFPREELTKAAMQNGISHMHWEGRMEELLPGVILDGAHNEDGMTAFLTSVAGDGCIGKRTLLFSAVSDKQVNIISKRLMESGLFQDIAVVGISNQRGIPVQALQQLFQGFAGLQCFSTVEEACRSLIEQKTDEDYIYVAGSLYLVGQARAYISTQH